MNPVLAPAGVDGYAALRRAVARKTGRLWWLALPVLGATGLATMTDAPHAAAWTFVLAMAVVLQLLWWSAASALLGLNDPISAHLMPGQLRKLRETAVVTMLGLAVLSGLLLSAVFGHAPAFAAASAAAMLAFAACLRWPLLWFGVWILPGVLLPLLGELPAARAVAGFFVSWHERQPLIQAAVILLALAAALWGLFQSGGAGHAKSWQASQRMRQAMSMQAGGSRVACAGGPFARLGRVFQWGLPLWRKHLLRTARPDARSVSARAELGAMRGLHWSATGSTGVVLALCLLGFEAAALIFVPERAGRIIDAALPGVSIGLMSGMLSPLFGLATTLHQTRREQALLALVPGMPRGDAMNRELARRMLRHYVAMWAGGVAMILVASALAPGDMAMASRPLLGLDFAAAALPVSLMIWRDWSRQGAPRGIQVGLLTMITLLGMGLCTAASSYWRFSPLWLVGASMLLTLTLGVWRWRLVRRVAPFWPVGRHA